MKKIKRMQIQLLSIIIFIPILFSSCGSTEKKDSLNLSVLKYESFIDKKLFAHRGLWGGCPENTMNAFQAAYDKGFRGLELDIRFTKDNVPVVFHDENLKRMSGIKNSISALNYDEIQKIKIGNTKQIKNGTESFIPSFKEYCSWVNEKKDITTIIELKSEKNWTLGNENFLIEMISDFSLADRVIFISSDIQPLLSIKKSFPQMKCFFLTDDKKLDVCNIALENKFDGISIHWKLAKIPLIEQCHKNNILVNTWTADSYKKAYSLLEKGVDFVTGNF